jgi:hypothetical protein
LQSFSDRSDANFEKCISVQVVLENEKAAASSQTGDMFEVKANRFELFKRRTGQ